MHPHYLLLVVGLRSVPEEEDVAAAVDVAGVFPDAEEDRYEPPEAVLARDIGVVGVEDS